ncbi:MAG: prepilin-type N-terminal cleavage/methylation domain-containing protein, partial [Alphaproteobacteria bacterium]|nr:prepilin-type N-terminal cleavage/methylation domain-containing protein [Alphaproteobacteria bacterium]
MRYEPNIVKTARNAGFTLLELSIVIIIISMIASAGLTLGIKRTEGSKKEITQQRMDKIEDAIGAFLVRNGCLPCPADGSLAVSDASFGIGDAVAPCTACTTNVIATVPPISAGTVPIVDLQLSDEYMFDGWGRRFTYVIEPTFATTAGFAEANMGAWGTKNGAIKVFARGDDSTTPPERTNAAVAVLVSHGDNGHGAWLKDGGANVRFDSGSTDVAE